MVFHLLRSSTHTINCNVLLSFLGSDSPRNRSFVSHLYGSLDAKGYTITELDNDPSRGESDVDRAITESKVAVVVISENFVSSPWGLESLVKVLEFHRSGSLGVLIPVFYEINPHDVKYESWKCLGRFLSHEEEKLANMKTWRQALDQLIDIPSCHYSVICKEDAELIGKITKDIWDFLIGSRSLDFCGLVGMDRYMKDIYRMLNFGSLEDVRSIQISGEHGIGKTELAKYMYEEILHHFDAHIWLDSHEYQTSYITDLAQRLAYDIRRKIKSNYRARVLLVLDNFRYFNYINDLRKEFDSFGPGSRVIITNHMEDSYLGNMDYRILGLEFSEALQLFCFHAFEQTHLSLGFQDLSSRAVKLAGGNPVRIKKLGTSLFGKERKEWEAILSDYERESDKGIIDSNKINLSKLSSVTDSVSIQSSTISDSDGLVGMDSRFQDMLELLELGSDKEVRTVGIWGTGGIGKTTLARYAYGRISDKFHTHVFLENVEDHSSSFCLEERFLSKAIEREAFAVRNSKDGLGLMKSWLRHQKILLVVDNVENNKGLEDVQKMASLFDHGSRIILITRDESLLLANGVKHAYEVKCLRFDEALQLFYQFALKQKYPSERNKQLSVYAIKLVGFLPLALKVVGSMLYGKDETYWETIFQSIEAKQDEGEVEASTSAHG